MVGYQAEGTMGRLLLEGAKRVRIQGDDITVNAQIRVMNDYSGHADGTELASWIEERQPIRKNLFLVHSELPASNGLKDRVGDRLIAHNRIIIPAIDDVFTLTAKGARRRKTNVTRRIAPKETAKVDWNNELTGLLLDINEAVEKSAGAKARDVIIRRLRRALERARG